MSIQDKLNALVDGKQIVVDSVNDKAGTDLTVESRWLDIADAVDSISAGSGPAMQTLITARGANAGYYLFYDSQEDISNPTYLSELDWSKNKTCHNMFGSATRDTHTNIKHAPYFDTSNVTTFNSMFGYASDLETLPDPFYDTSNGTTFTNFMITASNIDPNLEKLGRGKTMVLNCPKGTNLSYAFSGRYFKKVKVINSSSNNNLSNFCTNNPYLETLDLNTMDGITSTSYSNKIVSGQSLTKFIIRNATKVPALHASAFTSCYHFTGAVDATYNPNGLKDGRIYVPDAMVNSFKTGTNWSTYADIIVPLSTLQEE